MKPSRPEHHAPRRYEVRHTTTYTYTEDVTASYGRACLRPREAPGQQVESNEVRISPEPDAFTEHVDLFGNVSHYLEVHTPHRELVVSKTTHVSVERPTRDLSGLDQWTVGDAATATTGIDPSLRTAYVLPSTQVELGEEVREYAAGFLGPQARLGTALDGLVSGIFRDFRYAKGSTTVRTTLPQVLAQRSGVCQDFAHLAIGCLRTMGVPARYVSGYLETMPPPGKPKLLGSDATHAWVSVALPDGNWLDLDPTNDCPIDSRYVITAWGRDYRDVAPLKGVIFTEGTTTSLDVSVDVLRLPD